MGNLKEPVFAGYRADFYRFKKYVISWIAQRAPAYLEITSRTPACRHILKRKAAPDQLNTIWVIPKMKKIIGAIIVGTALVATTQLAQTATRKIGVASWYKMGKITANGERFNPNGLTAAHRFLPFGTVVRVTNLRNGRKVVVRINDRGPFVKNRIIDLAYGAARKIGLNKSGIAKVRLDIIKRK